MRRCVGAGIGLLMLTAGAVMAQDRSLSIQLNKLEPVESGCRIYFVLENRGSEPYDQLTVDLVTFDAAGIVGQRLLVELGPLRPAKTTVSSFDFTGLDCDAIARILVNDVTACSTPAGAPDDCMARIGLSTLSAELVY